MAGMECPGRISDRPWLRRYAGSGAWLLKTWRTAGLPLNETAGCPAAGNVWVWTAPSQRTKATGTALLDGMFPGCGIPIHFTAHKADPLFDTVAMGIAAPDKDKVYQQIEERLGSAARAEKPTGKQWLIYDRPSVQKR